MATTSRRRPRPPTGPQGLAVGPRVIETVRLAAEEGLSNQEIAERRHCSVHTVNNQLRAFYDFAKAAVPDDALWGRFRTTAQRRQGLPEIWRRVQAALPSRGPTARPRPAPP